MNTIITLTYTDQTVIKYATKNDSYINYILKAYFKVICLYETG